MSRWIDADKMYIRTAELEATALVQVNKMLRDDDRTGWITWSAILNERTAFKHDLMDAPTVDVRENVRAKWIKTKFGDYACSRCGGEPWYCLDIVYKFCPYCGAEMDDEVKEVRG